MTPALNILIRSALDRDAREYCAETGATDRRAISQFFRGVKNEGLWTNAVFWMLPAHQNFGTGTLVKSAGGLGTYNGTLVNGPTWGADGVLQSAYGQRITTTFDLTLSMSFFGVINRTSGYSFELFGQAANTSSGNPVIATLHNGTSQARWTWVNPTPQVTAIANGTNAGAFQSVGFSWGNSLISMWKDAVQMATDTAITGAPVVVGASQQDILIGGAYGGNTDSRGTNAIAAFFDVRISNVQYQAILSLYKSTLGQGLGLP